MYKTYQESTREEYYEQFTFPKNILQFQRWLNEADEYEIIKTAQPVNFRKVEFGASRKAIIKLWGKPRFVRNGAMFGTQKHEILFYKDVLDGNKLISQFHFLNDSFFYGCHTFRYLSQAKFYLIRNILFEKHIGYVPQAGKNILITDKNKNQIRCEDDVFLNLVYLNGNEILKTQIEEYAAEYSQIANNKQKEKFKEVYNFL